MNDNPKRRSHSDANPRSGERPRDEWTRMRDDIDAGDATHEAIWRKIDIVCERIDGICERIDGIEGGVRGLAIDSSRNNTQVLAAINDLTKQAGELRTLVLTRQSVLQAVVEGRDIENSSPPPKRGTAELKTPIGRLRGSQAWLAAVMITLGVVGGVAYVAATWGPPRPQRQAIGGK